MNPERIDSPFPGIRPATEPRKLKGRNNEILDAWRFLAGDAAAPGQYGRVLELTGSSGVGKTSLLEAGITPFFHSRKWTVDARRDWARSSQSDAVDLRPPDVGAGPCLLILDQLEELYLTSPAQAERCVKWACDLVLEKDVCVILSFRPEVRTEITDLVESRVPYRRFLYVPLKALEVESAVAIVQSASGEVEVDDDTAKEIAGLWNVAVPESLESWVQLGNVNLLHLQAAMVCLWHRALEAHGPVSDGSVAIDRSVPEIAAELDAARENPVGYFRSVLTDYLSIRLGWQASGLGAPGRSREGGNRATRPEAADARLLVTTAARIFPHLSSGGFKVARLAQQLAPLVLTGFRELGLADLQTHALRRAEELVTTLVEENDGDADASGLVASLSQELRKGQPSDAETDDAGGPSMVSGQLWGRPNEVAAAHLAIDYEVALRLLKDEGVIRIMGNGENRLVTLVHDGLGPAGAAWARAVLADPQVALDAVVAISGKQVLGDALALINGPESGADWATARPVIGSAEFGDVISGVRWLGCQITAEFSGVTFRDCDFTGSVFNRCVFRGATFERCDFTGALVLGASFEGGNAMVIDGGRSDAGGGVGLRTLTFLRSESTGELRDNIEIRNLGGYGLFVELVSGGLHLHDVDLTHLTLGPDPDDAALRVRVGPNTVLRHLNTPGKTPTDWIDGLSADDKESCRFASQ